MTLLFTLITLTLLEQSEILFDFNEKTNITSWKNLDDVVMGGRSAGRFRINEYGHGVFEGKVSLENNGGFSSIRHRLSSRELKGFSSISIRLRGDKKRYQFRVKSAVTERYSYIHYFETSGDWEIIKIDLSGMYPTFRGRKLPYPNFPGKEIEEMAFFIGNKTKESFRLEIDWIKILR